MNMSNGNREYKSDVFSMLMEDKKNALSVYNVLNGTNHTNPDDLEIYTLDKGVSLTVRKETLLKEGIKEDLINLAMTLIQIARKKLNVSNIFQVVSTVT